MNNLNCKTDFIKTVCGLDKLIDKRLRNERVSKLYRIIGDEKKSDLIKNCGTYREYGFNGEETFLLKAYFCKQRLCPSCTYRLAVKRAYTLLKMLENKSHIGKRIVFITLTVKNCRDFELDNLVNEMYKALRKFHSNANSFFKKRFSSELIKFECTYNKKTKTYHPHFHIMAECKDNYFSDSNLYIKQEDLLTKWKWAMDLDYNPVCDIRAVKKGDDKSIFEVAKYSAKDSDFAINANTLKTFDRLLKRRRLFTPMGNYKKTLAKMENGDLEDMNQIDVKTDYRGNESIIKFALIWNFQTKTFTEKLLKNTNQLAIKALEDYQ